MAIDLLGELLGAFIGEVFGAVISAAIGPWVKESKINEDFGCLSPEAKRAFLEVVAAAVLHDGKVSDEEREMFERQQKRLGSALVEEAVAVAGRATPFADAEACKAFVAQRASAFKRDSQREQLLTLVAAVLLSSGARDALVTVHTFGAALGVHRSRVDAILGQPLSM